MNTGRKDVIWNYAATILQTGVGVILLPFILNTFPQETVAIWTIFSTIMALTGLLDFGFGPSFARNVSYVVSGVTELKSTGYQIVSSGNNEIDYSLFKGLINAMRWFYSRLAILLFLLLFTAGTYYIYTVLQTYTGDRREVYIAWIILCTINTYSLYTLYYDSLLSGKGLIKQAKQIQVLGQGLYLIVAVGMILLHFNLIAIVSAQALSIVLRRILSYNVVYTVEFKKALDNAVAKARKDFIKPILPNAVKLGLTAIGSFLVSRSAILIGALYLSLDDIASYGITIQIVGIIAGIAGVYLSTYLPQIAQYRITDNISSIRKIYLHSCGIMLLTFIVCGAALLLLGNWALEVIHSQTPLLSQSFIAVALLVYLLETNHGFAGNILVTKNEVPFFKAALFAGFVTLLLLFVFFNITHIGVWSMILAQGIAQGIYQNWKWPEVVAKELNILHSGRKFIKARMQPCRLKRRKRQLHHTLIRYFQTEKMLTVEQQAIFDYLKENPMAVFPYHYTKNYIAGDVKTYFDNDLKMFYVLHNDKRLYFKKKWNETMCKLYYNDLLTEQDKSSPHRYETASFQVAHGDIVADVGAAEGIFALSVIDKVKKIYLFEVDPEWIEALEATFAPWKEKVVVVNKYVSDHTGNVCIALDDFFNSQPIHFIKADIEGAENQLLEGARRILQRQGHLKIVLCTYHKHDDAETLNNKLKEYRFVTEFSKGYVIFYYEVCDKLQPPYLRRALVRAWKS
ncbi:MAG: methyltransferase [Dysgonamonadaceae bacterium]|jgi:O-antigen/teichoic acid export membrane protein|nr:methyltransferase [Dysgonamonadaceae bacterium]